MTRQQLDVQVKNGGLVRVWYGVYAAQEPDLLGRLAALDVFMGGARRRVSGHRRRVVWIRHGKHRRYPYARSRSKDAAHGRSDGPPTRRCPAPTGVRSSRDRARMDCRGGRTTVAPPAGAGHPRRRTTVNALRSQ
ncbi:Conserved hypothetical protein [Mycobacterium tuberculosis variant bovis BCG str. Pasteur 1173P2]|uniref:Uncharacterized protein n=1 Tax=Mycobacterium bovis (strain BCG / Pasteur 1173P2) TaxID=410289 RepID=A0A0H3MC39_MYCBP|nr:Hypothetical protein BCGMEX_2253 [Mycobacterium tuberculosis variant bovis BCG str. Mexico]QCU61654.1 hypothetical protein FCU26_2278 [Mycobacterium tuberculosis variant bovis]CAL72253.1 Conserved hypothetical protein [Mycobacterium tuberculosis variant bovis BCG str. Pasteur 1173P2]CCC64842.1 conserved hypothetical protein [Mycobacterium tuberculosis variant bovis BCG str. Moreau RDJ]BAH26543.1 hypothetical protein JTY_2259 [Mycobacterium tuberculosis variant bovis BCG str. Tokyo 172]